MTDALEVGRPPGTSPGWTVWWNGPQRKEAIMPVRYKTDAINALAELLATDIDWTKEMPIPYGSQERFPTMRIGHDQRGNR